MQSRKRPHAGKDTYDSSDLDDSDDGREEKTEEPKAPPAKTEDEPPKKMSLKAPPKRAKVDGEWELSNTRRVTVSTFRRQVRIDIREFYESNGELKPGRKGISLTLDQWQKLKDLIPAIDEYAESL